MLAALALCLAMLGSDIWVSTNWNFDLRLPPQIIRVDADYNQHVMPDNTDEYHKESFAAQSNSIITFGGVASTNRRLEIWSGDSRTVSSLVSITPFIRESHNISNGRIAGYASITQRESATYFIVNAATGVLLRREEIPQCIKMLIIGDDIYFFSSNGTITWFAFGDIRNTITVSALSGIKDAAYDGNLIWIMKSQVVTSYRIIDANPDSWQPINTYTDISRPRNLAADLNGRVLINGDHISLCYQNGVLVGNMLWPEREDIADAWTLSLILNDNRVAIPRLTVTWNEGNFYWKSRLDLFAWPQGGQVNTIRSIKFDRPIMRIAQ